MRKLFNFLKSIYDLILVTALAFWLRFVNLGYSDYQGDEIKALFIPNEGQSVANFLLTQRKGPVQFIITYLLKFLTPDYSDRLLMRLPFALAGTLAVIFFYKLLRIFFNKRISFFAAFFIATNGFFVAFSRIVQYQSFVIMFMTLSLYFFSLAATKDTWKVKGLYLGFTSWALSALSHYDAVFIAPFVLYTIYLWSQKYEVKEIKPLIKEFLFPFCLFLALLLSFYIPFVMEISTATLSYWQNRITDTGTKVSSSIYLFRVYQPIYVIHIYTILSILGGIKLSFLLYKKFKEKDCRRFLLYTSTIFWVMFPFVFMEVIVDIPGTHIYAYLLPVFIILSFGTILIQDTIQKLLSKIAYAKFLFWLGITIVFSFTFMQSNQIFVDHGTEYPWENEKFYLWTFSRPVATNHLSIFGFPYYRHWDSISQFISNSENNGYFSTNEKDSITRHHINLKKDADKSGYYIYVKKPQNFEGEISKDKVLYWIEKYPPVASFFKDGSPIVEIFYMAPGTLQEIVTLGF